MSDWLKQNFPGGLLGTAVAVYIAVVWVSATWVARRWEGENDD